jgi:hypothetical protein
MSGGDGIKRMGISRTLQTVKRLITGSGYKSYNIIPKPQITKTKSCLLFDSLSFRCCIWECSCFKRFRSKKNCFIGNTLILQACPFKPRKYRRKRKKKSLQFQTFNISATSETASQHLKFRYNLS